MRPLKRVTVRSLSAASCTFATSPKPHEVPVLAARDHEIAEVLLRLEADERAQREFARAGLEPACRQLDVLAPQCGFDVGDGEPARRERLPIDPDAHGIAPAAADADARDARNGGETIDEIALGVVGDFEHRHRCRS